MDSLSVLGYVIDKVLSCGIVVCSYLVNFNSIHQLLTYDMHVHTLCIRSFMMLRAMHFLSNLKVVSKYVIQAAATIGNNIQSQ